MRGTGRIILGIFGFTSIVMFYVHLQVVTFLASYEIHSVSEKIYDSTEQFRKLKFEVDRYKAPHLLEGRIREYEMKLALPEMVYRVPQSFSGKGVSGAKTAEMAKAIGFPQFIQQAFNSWIQVAHAKSDSAEA